MSDEVDKLRSVYELLEYLKSANEECARPREDGSHCIQCYERAGIIYRLEEILEQPHGA
jgi:hypothetical protein